MSVELASEVECSVALSSSVENPHDCEITRSTRRPGYGKTHLAGRLRKLSSEPNLFKHTLIRCLPFSFRVVHYILFIGFVYVYVVAFVERTLTARRQFFTFLTKIAFAVFSGHKWISMATTSASERATSSADSFQDLDYLILVLMLAAILWILLFGEHGDGIAMPGSSEEPPSEREDHGAVE